MQTETDASNDVRSSFYTARGYLTHHTYSRPEVGAAGKFYEVLEHDAWGHVTQERRGGTVTTVKGFDPLRGWIDTVVSGGGGLQSWNFDFDTNGNLTRRNGKNILIEDFVYDKLNRLTQTTLSGPGVTPVITPTSYDKLGNLCIKGAVSYTYEGPDGCNGTGIVGRPHVLSQVGTSTVMSDALGNHTIMNAAADADDYDLRRFV